MIFECICDEVIEIKEEKDSYVYQDREYEVKGFIKAVRPQAPSNCNDAKSRIVHTNSDCPCYILDKQSGISKSTDRIRHNHQSKFSGKGIYGKFQDKDTGGYNDLGDASRFYYQSKASPSEKHKGCENLYWLDGKRISKELYEKLEKENQEHENDKNWQRHNIQRGNIHITVKPLSLMKYLVRLVTPPNELVLGPLCG